jgi:predicted transcriptional regulator
MITKTQIIDSLNNLPENVTIDQVIEHLIVIEKIQKGLEDSASGEVYSKEQAKDKLKKWLK